jgi:putative modified peptide
MSFNLPEAVVDSLLHKLGSDDAFREQFIANPRHALAGLGFAPAADDSIQQGIWMCLSVTELASKEAILASNGALRRQLTAERATFNPHSLVIDIAKRAA